MDSTNCLTSIKSHILSWWSGLPLFTMLTIIICLILSIFIDFNSFPAHLLIVNSEILFSKYNFWCIFTFPYQHHSLIHYIFAIISFVSIAYKKENTMGTARYFIFFTLNNLILGVIFICIGSAMKFVDTKILNFLYSYPIYGLWSFIMVEMVIKYNVQPDREVNFWFTSFPIKSKYYPWLFFVMFSVIFDILWYLLIGICIGYLRK